MTDTATAPAPAPPRPLRWWKEVLFGAAVYAVYSFVRNQFGSAGGDPGPAFEHAREIIDLQKAVGLFHEETIQEWFLDWRWFIQFWNLFYGTFHFVVTAGCIVWLFVRFPERYIRWRTASKSATEPATEALSDSARPGIGMRALTFAASRAAAERPAPSLPTRIATGPRRSTS